MGEDSHAGAVRVRWEPECVCWAARTWACSGMSVRTCKSLSRHTVSVTVWAGRRDAGARCGMLHSCLQAVIVYCKCVLADQNNMTCGALCLRCQPQASDPCKDPANWLKLLLASAKGGLLVIGRHLPPGAWRLCAFECNCKLHVCKPPAVARFLKEMKLAYARGLCCCCNGLPYQRLGNIAMPNVGKMLRHIWPKRITLPAAMAGAYFEVRKWSFCISKKGIGRFSGLEDRLQSDFRAIPSCLLDFSPGTMQFGDRSASGVNKWRPKAA